MVDVQALKWNEDYLFAAGGYKVSGGKSYAFIQKFDMTDLLPFNQIYVSNVGGLRCNISFENLTSRPILLYRINELGDYVSRNKDEYAVG